MVSEAGLVTESSEGSLAAPLPASKAQGFFVDMGSAQFWSEGGLCGAPAAYSTRWAYTSFGVFLGRVVEWETRSVTHAHHIN